MIKDNQKYFNRLTLIMDFLVIMFSYFVAWYLKFKTPLFDAEHEYGRLPFSQYMSALVIIAPLFLVLYVSFHMYTSRRIQGAVTEIANIIRANSLGIILVLTALYITRQHDYSREMLFIFYIINMLLEIAFRLSIRAILRAIRKSGFNMKHILIVGYSRAAESYIDRIRMFPQWGFDILGILDDKVEMGLNYNEAIVFGRTSDLEKILAENSLDEIVIALNLDEYGKLADLVKICEKSGVHTQFVPDYNEIIPSRPYTEDIMGLPVINIRYVPLSNTFNAIVKRAFDILCSSVGLIILSPLLLMICIIIKATSKGPLIFKQERVGFRNETFMMYKFRSMKVQDEAEEKKAWTVKDDPRVTKFGKFIRKTSLDELPQLVNILKGDMSIVGPRPERPFFVEKFKEEIPRYMIKHQVRPGLTGWAQVNGLRGDTSIKKRIEYDLYYIENWTFWFDIKIMFLTIFKGFVNKNAY